MKILASVVLSLALIASPYTLKVEMAAAATLPWKTFSGSTSDVTQARPAMCRQSPSQVLAAQLEKDGKTYLYFASEEGRYVFAEMGANGPVWIWAGSQLPSPDHDKIVPSINRAASEVDEAGPCQYLYPDQA